MNSFSLEESLYIYKAYVTDVLASKHELNTIYVSFNYHKYGDFKPYLVVTKDGGKTWKSISNNIPKNNFVWSIVEDHINPNLLFIGTEFGMFYSINAGNSWNKFKNQRSTYRCSKLKN